MTIATSSLDVDGPTGVGRKVSKGGIGGVTPVGETQYGDHPKSGWGTSIGSESPWSLEYSWWTSWFFEINRHIGPLTHLRDQWIEALKGRRTVEKGNRNTGGAGGFWHIVTRTIYNRRLVTIICSGLSR
ncbi:hypothetical protein GOBAR_DD13623 [Gossypium barbadense]|nr:hypothetical protein GOBAR_DD13623 [Gossypium barbadense]